MAIVACGRICAKAKYPCTGAGELLEVMPCRDVSLKSRSQYCFAITDKGGDAPDQYNPSHRPLGRRRMTAQRSDHECCTASTGDFEKVSSGKVVLSYTPLVPYGYYLVDIIDSGRDMLAVPL